MTDTVNRRVTYKMYPSASQAEAMDRACDMHRRLYNAALEERIEAWRRKDPITGKGILISFGDQCKGLTQIRAADPAYLAINAQSAQVTLKRLDLAFKAFFRRVKSGQEPGFPRFQSHDRFSGFGFKTHGDGFRFTPGADWKHGRLKLSGIGTMIARGVARTQGEVVCADIQRKTDGWVLSIVVSCRPQRERGDLECGLDWGVETFATLATAPGEYDAVENDRFLLQDQDALKEDQRALSKALRGKRSKRAAKKKLALARRSRKIANRRKNRNHQVTARLVRDHKLIVTEDLSISNMTATARGTIEEPGSRIAQKAGLNRSILDASPGAFLNMLTYKAEEAGATVEVLNTRKYKPSQTCPCCLRVIKKALSERQHRCDACGFTATRDQASALVMLGVGLRLAGREPAWASASWPETVHPSRSAA